MTQCSFSMLEALGLTSSTTKRKEKECQACWYMPVILTLGRLRQKDPREPEASLNHIMNSGPK